MTGRPTVFNFDDLAERLVAHRLSQPDLAILSAAPSQLIDVFRRCAGVFALGRAFESRAPVGEMLATITQSLVDALRARLCRLVLVDRARGDFIALRGDCSIGDEPRLAALAGIAGKVLADGKGRIAIGLEGCADLDPASDLPAGEQARQLLCVALSRDGGKATGVLQLFDKCDGTFTNGDRILAETAAPYITELVLRGGLIGTGSDDEPSPERIIEPVGAGEDVSGRELMLSKILAVAIDMLDADRGSIFLYDPATDELCARHADGLGGRELRIDPGLGLVGAAYRSGEIVNIADAYQDPRFHPTLDWRIGYRTRSMLCAPIFGNDGQRVGVVQLLNKRRGNFTAADERRVKGLASQMGVAADYSQLFEEILSIKSYNESMLSSLTNGVVTVDLARTVTFINPAASRILRLDGDSAIGRRLADIFGGFNAWVGEAVEETDSAAGEKLLPNSEFYIESEDEWVAVNLAIVPLRDGRQAPLGTMLVIEDMQREKELRRTMSRYMSNEVIDRLMVESGGGLEGNAHEVTILFSDIRGFTALAERLGAGETVSMLNEYFSFMEDVVTNRSGIIDKYIGDAIMALFGSPFPSDHDAANAVQAATDMFQVLQMLNTRRAADGRAAIRIGVGIGTGTVITGNIGSPKRMDFTVIGDPVNLASRIETATKTYGAEILVCGTTWSRLASPPRARRLDLVRLRGQSRPTELWEILDRRPDIPDAAIDTYRRALDAYIAGDWGRALRQFEEALVLRADDKAALLMVGRCRGFLASPPEDWHGVIDLD
jgi:adenylate cyclase